jgi:hypothetical protein
LTHPDETFKDQVTFKELLWNFSARLFISPPVSVVSHLKERTSLELFQENIWSIRAEITGGRRKLHEEELHNLYS